MIYWLDCKLLLLLLLLSLLFVVVAVVVDDVLWRVARFCVQMLLLLFCSLVVRFGGDTKLRQFVWRVVLSAVFNVFMLPMMCSCFTMLVCVESRWMITVHQHGQQTDRHWLLWLLLLMTIWWRWWCCCCLCRRRRCSYCRSVLDPVFIVFHP